MNAMFFVYKISQTVVEKIETEEGIIYRCYGQLFFASTTHFLEKFDFDISNQTIGLDVTHLKFWDESACEKLLQKTSLQYSIMPEYVD